MTELDQVILVDRRDNIIGNMSLEDAHKTAKLHRAISVFLFNEQGNWLLNKRSSSREHSNGLWSNCCNTHPYPGESNLQAAVRQLKHEMGLQEIYLIELFSFIYLITLNSDYTEHEYDHVFIGFTDHNPNINTELVEMYNYLTGEDISIDLRQHPENYSYWLQLISGRLVREIASQNILPHI